MEDEGIVGQANHAGKREILVPEEEGAVLRATDHDREIDRTGREIATRTSEAEHGRIAATPLDKR